MFNCDTEVSDLKQSGYDSEEVELLSVLVCRTHLLPEVIELAEGVDAEASLAEDDGALGVSGNGGHYLLCASGFHEVSFVVFDVFTAYFDESEKGPGELLVVEVLREKLVHPFVGDEGVAELHAGVGVKRRETERSDER